MLGATPAPPPKKDGVACIVAATAQMGIGRDGTLPWRLKGDMAYFKRVTTEAPAAQQNAVVMGRKTWLSIPKKFRPLPGRANVVLSRNPDAREQLDLPEDVACYASLDAALTQMKAREDVARVFVIGGGELYKAAIGDARCTEVLLTRVEDPKGILPQCDAFFPDLTGTGFTTVSMSPPEKEGDLAYSFQTLTRECSSTKLGDVTNSLTEKLVEKPPSPPPQNKEEQQYLDLIREILDTGVVRGDRTGTGTKSIFGARMKFSLRDDVFPLLTTKRVFWRGVAEELLWFVSGATNGKLLQDKNIHIWDGNGSREFLDKRGLPHREEMDLGPVYGFQWRHFGAQYGDMHTNYEGKGVDQLAECIRQIKDDPNSRRIVLSAWNPADLPAMALPPCHMFCQFYVANGELSCQMYQRSADMGLGVPFNIASYALLTRMVAQSTGLKAGDFVHVIGDAHVYLNHIDALEEQLKRAPRPFPSLTINAAKKNIDDFDYDDFTVDGYKPYPKIQMEMAV